MSPLLLTGIALAALYLLGRGHNRHDRTLLLITPSRCDDFADDELMDTWAVIWEEQFALEHRVEWSPYIECELIWMLPPRSHA